MDLKLNDNQIKNIADRYRIISKLTSDFFYSLSVPPEGPMKIIWVDGAYQKLTGFTPKEISDSEDWKSIIHPQDLLIIKKATQTILRNRTCVFEYRIRAKTGALRWVRDHAQPVWSDDEKRVTAVIGAMQDISGQKQAEEALRGSEQMLSDVFENIQDGIAVLDTDLIIRRTNEVINKWHQNQLPLEGKKCHQCFHDLETPCVGCPALESIKSGKTEWGVVAGLPGIGIEWIELFCFPIKDRHTGAVTGVIEHVRDITDRRKAETALQESEKRYRRFFLEDLSGAYITKPDGRMIACNPAFARIFGFSSVPEALESRMESIYHETSSRVEYLKILHKNKKLVNFKSIMRHRDGSSLNIVENTIGIYDDQGKLVEIKGFLVDVTRQTKLEAQLRKARKMETVGTLAGGIAHEFNNLLMTIQGNTSLIQYDLDTADPHFQMLVKIEEAVARGVKLTQQLLGYAKKGKYEVKSLNLNRLIQKIANTFGRSKNDITVRFDLSEDIPAILADQDQIEQVLLNLLANAADAMADRGKLILKTSNVTHDHIQSRLYDPIPGDYIKLAVTDSGSGMDEATRDRIFDPFFTTKGMGNGQGLGLASVYGIIKSHGGYIEVESEKGRGSTFNIFLPASRKKIPEAQISSGEDAAKDGVILMAEDEDLVLEVGVRFLNKLGYTALIARNGYEAVEVYKEKRDAISLVIMDMIMPHMGGGQAYDNIKRINPDVKVLLSSGYSIDGQAQEILDRGCDGFIQKPFSMEQLADKINAILTDAT